MRGLPFPELFEECTVVTNPFAQRPSFEEQSKYLQSSENKEICKPHILTCEHLAKVVKECAPELQDLKHKADQNIVLEEYSTGGEVLHRGFYCPSPIMDVVTGNCNRGKLLRRVTQRSKPSYKYGFNQDGSLLLVTSFRYDIDAIGIEIITRSGEQEIGISFQEWSGGLQLERVSECLYQHGRLVSYIDGLYCHSEKYVTSLKKEEYEYSDAGLTTAHMYSFTNDKVEPLLGHQEYRFKHDEEGYLSQYVAIEFPNRSGDRKPIWNGHVYGVDIKRKA